MAVNIDLTGKVALVTGGSGDIGRAIVKALAQAGANVVINCNSDVESATGLKAELKDLGVSAQVVQADVSDAKQVGLMVSSTVAAWGHIDILVNNAGVNVNDLLMRLSEGAWDWVIKTNLKGTFLCTQAVLRPMQRQGSGRIINMSSIVGIIGNAGQAPYGAAKAGIINLTKTTALEASKKGITVNAIAPGLIRTKMWDPVSEAKQAEFLRGIPLIRGEGRRGESEEETLARRWGYPEDVANLVVFLSSDMASYINGQVITIDGGLVMN